MKSSHSQSSTLPGRSKSPPPKPKLVNKLASPTASLGSQCSKNERQNNK